MRPLAALICLAIALPAQARVTRLDIIEQAPFAGGAPLGPAGSYVIVRAIAHGELDPAAPGNGGIALIDKAPRNIRGMVEYDTDVEFLHPADPARASGLLVFDVPNRGNKFITAWLDDAPELPAGSPNDPRTLADAGNRFIFRGGDTMVWAGWQPEAPTANHGMTIRLPVATNAGLPIVATIRDEFLTGTRGPANERLIHLPYPVADMQSARLTTRARQADPPTKVPFEGWRWVDHQTIQLSPFGTTPTPVHIYELTYEATRPTVDGIGFAAVRDVVSYLRAETHATHAIGFGVSLSGRFLRHFLDLGMNDDEDGHRVFDGVLAHISGAGKVFANLPFAMPYRTATQHEDRFYPENWAPVGYQSGATLLRDPAVKIIDMNTSTEYWQKGASLVHMDAEGDLPLPPNVRMYLVAGTQHGGHHGTPMTPGACTNPRNPNSAGPALRAALTNLRDWVLHDTPPPDSLVPRRSDGTAVPAASIRMPAVAGVTWPTHDNPVSLAPIDWVHPPATLADPLPTFVAAVDADGNETAGIRLPHVAAPLGTYAGINTYRDVPGELCDRDGSYVPFARTKAEREAAGDPRPSLEERYGGRDAYVAQVTKTADALVAARLLLPEDRDAYVEGARTAPGF